MTEGCPSNRSGCFAENDVSGTDCVFVKQCYPEHLKKNSDKGVIKQ
jgi:hypothetical protein